MTNKETQTAEARKLIEVVASEIADLSTIIRIRGRSSSSETKVTIIMHGISDILAITADQSFGPHHWEKVIERTLELSLLASRIFLDCPKGVNLGCGYETAEL